MNKNKVTFAAFAVIGVALSLAVVPALTNQVFAQDCPGCHGKGHETVTVQECTNPSGKVKGTECPGQSEKSESQDETTTTTTFAGKSGNPKGSTSTTE